MPDLLVKEMALEAKPAFLFTTPHFDGHTSVLLRGSRVGELSRDELAGFVECAWLARAGMRAIARWQNQRDRKSSG